jgi:hypothetical protein
MGFSGSVITDNEDPFIILRTIKLKLGYNQVSQMLRHPVGDHISLHQMPGHLLSISLTELDNGFDGIKLDEIAILHSRCSFVSN